MANISLYALRVIATKEFLSYSPELITAGGGQEVVSISVPEEDFYTDIISQKYRFNAGTGVLEIKGVSYYFLELSNNAVQFNPASGIPRLNVGGVDFFTLTVRKKDIQGNYHTDATDNDTIYVSVLNGDMADISFSLVNGVGTGDIYSGDVRGITTLNLEVVDIFPKTFTFETI